MSETVVHLSLSKRQSEMLKNYIHKVWRFRRLANMLKLMKNSTDTRKRKRLARKYAHASKIVNELIPRINSLGVSENYVISLNKYILTESSRKFPKEIIQIWLP